MRAKIGPKSRRFGGTMAVRPAFVASFNGADFEFSMKCSRRFFSAFLNFRFWGHKEGLIGVPPSPQFINRRLVKCCGPFSFIRWNKLVTCHFCANFRFWKCFGRIGQRPTSADISKRRNHLHRRLSEAVKLFKTWSHVFIFLNVCPCFVSVQRVMQLSWVLN